MNIIGDINTPPSLVMKTILLRMVYSKNVHPAHVVQGGEDSPTLTWV